MRALLPLVVILFSFIGTMLVGIGLQSYGFMDKAFLWLSAFIASQMLIMALGRLPPRFWED